MLAISQRQCRSSLSSPPSWISFQTRSVSNSPYGRTHVWKRRPPVLPNPVVPKYPQHVIRSDGSSFTHWTTSPRSIIRLIRDTTNHPVWNTGSGANDRGVEEETGAAGRLGRFSRKYQELGSNIDDISWLEQMASETAHALPTITIKPPPEKKAKGGKR